LSGKQYFILSFAFELIESILGDPFTGIGKPEPLKLKNVLAGCAGRAESLRNIAWCIA